ncbi:Hsp90 co-chaperone Cdc37 [Grifola frondosa]|uniref:Hsp90 chaperone protein kinase-targeting subunit n=1 Tax=Grifola frondosa TaxID=5627 RepID=A0A1C7M0R8_GRIFR|nr:Hsp90 co-chaperone Cdc37 [Grifola frondosa]
MPLNYSKWDKLELSDDSDIEGHPNVDKKSLIRWKQRDIHEKREARKHHIAQLHAEIACDEVLRSRLRQIVEDVASQGPPHFSALVERFKTQPSPEAPPSNAPEPKTYDEMLLSLMLQVWETAKKDGVEKDDASLGDALISGLKRHVVKLGEVVDDLRKRLHDEEEEQKKKITSEDLHEGFESHYVPPIPEPPAIKGAIVEPKKHTATEYEVINPRGVAAAPSTFSQGASSSSAAVSDEETDDLPELTPSLEKFSHLPLRAYEESWEFVKEHRDVIVPGAADALLVAAFRAQSRGDSKWAQQCVHQSLLLQYCEKLGKDGWYREIFAQRPSLRRMLRTHTDTSVERVRISKAEEAAGGNEQIQLVPENPSQSITFNVPDGPPPETIQLEGPGFENIDIEDVRKALQMRWDVFQSFNPPLQKALKAQSLDEVNKVLGRLNVEKAEEIVKLLDLAGILSFSDGGIRDETGQSNEEDGDEADEEDEAVEESKSKGKGKSKE